MRLLRIVVTALLLAVAGLTAPALATSFSTDQSDLYYIPTEAGWGIQLVQRGPIIFITMFVYDPVGKPIWYVGTIYPTATPLLWEGDIYVTNGPWFGTQPYDPALFGGRIVGTMTWQPNSVVSGVLEYTVDGVAVSKFVVRQTLVADNFSGRFVGAVHETFAACADPDNNGTVEEPGIIAIAQSGNQISLTTTPFAGGGCTYTGTLFQDGQMGAIGGNYACTNGLSGTFDGYEMQVTLTGLTARFSDITSSNGCSRSGWLGGVRTTQF